MKKMDPVVHFEMPAQDLKRMNAFYTRAFGWKTNTLNETMDNYTLVTTGETDKDGMLKKPGIINGGFYPIKKDDPAQHPSIVIAVDDVKETMENIKESGGVVLGEPVEIKGYGMYISFLDTEGNRVGVMQPFMQENKK